MQGELFPENRKTLGRLVEKAGEKATAIYKTGLLQAAARRSGVGYLLTKTGLGVADAYYQQESDREIAANSVGSERAAEHAGESAGNQAVTPEDVASMPSTAEVVDEKLDGDSQPSVIDQAGSSMHRLWDALTKG